MVRAGLTPERVAQAGAELADEIGFESVTVAEVARRFAVKPASLYSHVRSSADLKERIALLALREVADRGSGAVAGRSGKDALVALGSVYRDYAHQHPGRFAAMQMRLEPGVAAGSDGPRHVELARAVLRGYPIVDSEQPHAIRLLGSMFRGFAGLETSGSFDHSAPAPTVSWDRILDALDVMLVHWPSPSR